jgi:hypothetical protein
MWRFYNELSSLPFWLSLPAYRVCSGLDSVLFMGSNGCIMHVHRRRWGFLFLETYLRRNAKAYTNFSFLLGFGIRSKYFHALNL